MKSHELAIGSVKGLKLRLADRMKAHQTMMVAKQAKVSGIFRKGIARKIL